MNISTQNYLQWLAWLGPLPRDLSDEQLEQLRMFFPSDRFRIDRARVRNGKLETQVSIVVKSNLEVAPC